MTTRHIVAGERWRKWSIRVFSALLRADGWSKLPIL
jgi:hypothetical protein